MVTMVTMCTFIVAFHSCFTYVVCVCVSLQDIASLGSPDWSNPSLAYSLGTQDGQFGPGFSSRGVVKGSPVVPGSSQKVLEEGDQVLYTVTVLRGQYQVRLVQSIERARLVWSLGESCMLACLDWLFSEMLGATLFFVFCFFVFCCLRPLLWAFVFVC